MFAGTLRLKVVETLTLQSAICNIGFGEKGKSRGDSESGPQVKEMF